MDSELAEAVAADNNATSSASFFPDDNVQEKLAEQELRDLYGVGAKILFKYGQQAGEGLGGSETGIASCLQANKHHSAGRGLGFGRDGTKQPLDVWRFRVEPPQCRSCKLERWPAKQSKKRHWHCGFCLCPQGGRPRCQMCSLLTWDGWNGPKCVWYCSTCYSKQQKL